MVAGKRRVESIRWSDPPPVKHAGPKSRREGIAGALRANPGVWAELQTYDIANSAYTTASLIKSGRSAWSRPAGSFEAVARKTDEGEYTVFIRYIGGDADGDE